MGLLALAPRKTRSHFLTFQMNSQCMSAVLHLKSAADDNMTWTKGEVLGKGAYGVVSGFMHTIKIVQMYM